MEQFETRTSNIAGPRTSEFVAVEMARRVVAKAVGGAPVSGAAAEVGSAQYKVGSVFNMRSTCKKSTVGACYVPCAIPLYIAHV